MNIFKAMFLIICLSVFLYGYAIADEFYIYPNKGQSNEQIEQDKYACYEWAKQQSGFDPMAPPTATAPPPPKQDTGGGAVQGAARGALLGVAVGAIAGDAGKGAAYGAAAGGLMGGMKKKDQEKKQAQAEQQWENQQGQQYAQKRDNYNRAYTACLEGKGYTVK